MIPFGLRFEVDETVVEAAANELAQREIDNITKEVAQTARSEHSFTNRTGTLERSIVSIKASGNFMNGTLEGRVESTADYSGFVEYGTSRMAAKPYLTPAIEKVISAFGPLEPKGYF